MTILLRVFLTVAAGYGISACMATPPLTVTSALAPGELMRLAATDSDDSLALKEAALQALMNAPPERALSMIERVMRSDADPRLKKRALFVLGQIELPGATDLLITTAKGDDEVLREVAIRTIGIQGDKRGLQELVSVYQAGDRTIRRAVLHAFLIADADQQVYEVARAATSEQEFDDAVGVLGSMGAIEKLRSLKDRASMSEGLIRAYAVAEDIESLAEVALSGSDEATQRRAIRAMGVVGGERASALLMQFYRTSDSAKLRRSALEGLMVADEDQAILTLFRESNDDREKRDLLRMLVNMDSDAALDVIDSALGLEE